MTEAIDTKFCTKFSQVSQTPILRKNLFKEFEKEQEGEKVSVYLRVKPTDKGETSDSTLVIIDPKTVCCKMTKDVNTGAGNRMHSDMKFTFSRVFGPEVGQRKLFDSCVIRRIRNVLKGKDCLLFTYGTTNAGKTYTILGKPNQPGIIPQSLEIIFSSIKPKIGNTMMFKPDVGSSVIKLDEDAIEKEQNFKDYVMRAFAESKHGHNKPDLCHKKDMATTEFCVGEYAQMVQHTKYEPIPLNDDDSQYVVWISYVEIYNEIIYDLLEPLPPGGKRTQLKFCYDKQKIPYVKGLHHVCVSTPDEAYKVLVVGKMNLHFASTNLNARSSRSHCIFTIKLVKYEDKEEPNWAEVTSFAICDLAGTERQDKTGNVGDRLKESKNINTSLHTLGRCFQILRDNQMKTQNTLVPYRDSKLTQLFQKFLDGKHNEQLMMVVNANPCPKLYEETYCVLRPSAVAFQLMSQPSVLTKSDKTPNFPIMAKKNTMQRIEETDDNLPKRPKLTPESTPKKVLKQRIECLKLELARAYATIEVITSEACSCLSAEACSCLSGKHCSL